MPAVFYTTAKKAAIKASAGTMDGAGKVKLTLEFPKNYERAYPGLPKDMIATAEFKKDDVTVRFNSAKCALDKDRKCVIELESATKLSDSVKAKPFPITLSMNFEQPAVEGREVLVTAEPAK